MRARLPESESPAPAAAELLRSSGRALDPATRADAERRLGHDFSRVRIHSDARGAAAAGALQADAFTVGDHVAFAAGRFAPGTADGRRLLMHELAHVVQQSPARDAAPADAAHAEREADAAARAPALSRHPVGVQRQPTTTTPPVAGITRIQLAAKLQALFGHAVKITVGDEAGQTKQFRLPQGTTKLPDWKLWDPGVNSTVYDQIATAFTDVQRDVGGLPDIKEIVFYAAHYGFDANGAIVKSDSIPAMISRDVIQVYSSVLFTSTIIAGGTGIYQTGIPLATDKSTKNAVAPASTGGTAESQRRTIAHELGHGIEAATGALSEFEKAVGWSRFGGSLRLFDIQAKSVRKAIDDDKDPPASALITDNDWNSASHGEQPMRAYAVRDSTEDFADSFMAWLYARDALKKRSPARHKFFDTATRRSGWLPKLVSPPAAATPSPVPAPAPASTTKAGGS